MQGLARFDFYFKEVGVIINEKPISSRVRFMLQDLVDLRRSQWKPRRDVAGPKTIEQVRCLHSGGSKFEFRNLNAIPKPNFLKFGFGMVRLIIAIAIATAIAMIPTTPIT